MSDTVKSAAGMIQTPTLDTFVAGGPSSSEQLNAFRGAIVEDLAELDRRTQETQADLVGAQAIMTAQVAALASRFNSLEARLPSVAGRYMADFFTDDYLHATNEAAIDNRYGQATLPILHSQEKLVGEDSRGRIWVPKSTRLSYSYKDTTPDDVDWLTDENAVRALDQRTDTAWWRERGAEGDVWVRLELPVNLNANKFANCVTLHPFPVLTNHLMSVEYRKPDGTWSSADLSYLEGWDALDVSVLWCGNVRLFIPQSQVIEVRIRMHTESGTWGFTDMSVKQVEFQPTATLVLDYAPFSPGTLAAVQLLGKDTDTLSYLQSTINATRVSINLTQNTGNASPVLTGVEARE